MTTALKNLATGFRNIKLDFRKAAKIWIAFGALSGANLSGCEKLGEILNEDEVKSSYPTFEIPIRAVYQTSRFVAYSCWGAAIGGITAATAPISIPLYISMMK